MNTYSMSSGTKAFSAYNSLANEKLTDDMSIRGTPNIHYMNQGQHIQCRTLMGLISIRKLRVTLYLS